MFRSKLKIVDQLKIGTPCPVPNFSEYADQAVEGWYCRNCEKSVYDLSKFSRREISKLVNETEGHFCAMISRRTDGSIITNDPLNPSASFLSAGVLLASTTLLASQALAQTDISEMKALPTNSPIVQMRGEAVVSPVHEVPEAQTPSCENENSDPTAESSKPSTAEPRETLGRVVVEPRR